MNSNSDDHHRRRPRSPHGQDNREYHNRHKTRSPEWERRSRDQRGPKERERSPINRPNWQREERRYQGPSANMSKVSSEMIPKINRKEVCPFYVRVFYSINRQNALQAKQAVPESEIGLHLWMDSSLREIGQLIRAHLPSLRTKQRFQFWRVYQKQGGNRGKEELGTVYLHRRSERIDQRYLINSRFSKGDCLDISIYYK